MATSVEVEPQEKRKRRRSNKSSMELIEDENSRTKSFKRRKETLRTKASQLSKLCDVDVCVVCFGPDRKVETWPENESEVCDTIYRYKGMSEEMREKSKEKCNLLGFLEKKKKLKHKEKNAGAERVFPTWDKRLNRLSEEELVGMCGALDSKLQELKEKRKLIEELEEAAPKNGEALVETHNEDALFPVDNNNNNNNVSMLNEGNPLPLALWINGYCLYNQQALLGYDTHLPRSSEDSGISGGNNYTSNNHLVLGNDLKDRHYGLVGESSNVNNHYFDFNPSTNSQTLDQVLPSNMRPTLPFFFDHPAYPGQFFK